MFGETAKNSHPVSLVGYSCRILPPTTRRATKCTAQGLQQQKQQQQQRGRENEQQRQR